MVVNSTAVIENSAAARALETQESEIRARVQAELDRVREALEAEERDLTRLREELDPEEFQARTRAFDQRVRAERRAAQERSALLLRFVRDARATLAAALPKVLDALRRELGAALIIDSTAVIVGEPALDVTAAAVARYDQEMAGISFEVPETLRAGAP